MKAYAFDHDGLFIGTVERQLDPLESEAQNREVFLLPANATPQEPPAVGEGERLRWSGSLWIAEPIPAPKEERAVEEEQRIPTDEEQRAELALLNQGVPAEAPLQSEPPPFVPTAPVEE